jgi:hypothetical protein
VAPDAEGYRTYVSAQLPALRRVAYLLRVTLTRPALPLDEVVVPAPARVDGPAV